MLLSKSVSSGILCAAILMLSIPLYVSAQEQKRVLALLEVKSAPETKVLEIVEIEAEGKPVRLGEPFNAGRDWFKTLVFRIKNISAKRVKTVVISFNVPELDRNESKVVVWNVPYNIMRVGVSSAGTDVWEYVPPGGEVDLRFTGRLLDSPLHKSLDEIAAGVSEVKFLRQALVTFTDGTQERGGLLMR